MKAKRKLLVFWLLVIVVASIVVTHIGDHLRFVLEHCPASILLVLRR